MQTLIIKATPKCNFSCSFCSAKALNIKHSDRIPEKVREHILKTKPKEIIVVGGDPLLVKPEYYYELLNLTDNVSITTNLKGFMENPSIWVDLFKKPNFHISTSFQYGSLRKDETGVFDENRFINCYNTVLKTTGKKVPFISVIGKENENRAIDHVYLAKKLDTECRLNAMLPIGLSKEWYPRYKMLELYLDIEDLGLGKYEQNVLNKNKNSCPIFTTKCADELESCWIDNDGNLIRGICDDYIGVSKQFWYNNNPKNINKKCFTCELFSICNNCKANQYCVTKYADEEYCNKMLALYPRLLKNGWKVSL